MQPLSNIDRLRKLGPYRLLAELGHGGMSTVRRAERCDGSLQREVAGTVDGDFQIAEGRELVAELE